LAFLDGCAEQEVCEGCALEISKLTYGMNFIIALLGSKEAEDYFKRELNES
jgi:hypothetical protein